MRRLAAAGAGLVAAVVAVIVITVLVLVNILMSLGGGAPYIGGDDCLTPGNLSAGPANTDKRFFSSDENAARIYAQATGLGMGEVGALAAITAALQESSLKNGGRGDFRSDGTMTESRGLFQQIGAWVEPGRAWSGMKWTPSLSASWYADLNPVTGQPDPWNPWTGVKWALRDPRMDHAQATNMFLLGPNYNFRAGLEDTAAYKANAGKPVSAVSNADIATMVQATQHAGADRAIQMVPTARQYLARISSGELTVPAFIAPEPAIAKRATSKATKAALAKYGKTSITSPDATVAGDGLLLVGDSVMQGLRTYNKLPKTAFSGPLTVIAQRSMTLADVLDRQGTKTVAGTTVNLDTWRSLIQSGPSRILVELGTNPSGANTVEGITRFLQLAGPGKQVYWFSMHYQPAKGFDKALLEAARTNPNLHIVDVSGVVTDYSQMHPLSPVSRAMWSKAYTQMTSETAVPAQLIAVTCGGEDYSAFNDTIEPTGPYQAAAVTWARQHLSTVTGGNYIYAGGVGCTSCTDPDKVDFNCSTFTSASYRAATNDALQLSGYSDAQWQDTAHIQLIPASQAQPGDIMFEHNQYSGGKLTGHVGIIESLSGSGTVLHAAGTSVGIIRSSLKDRMGGGAYFVALKDPSNPSRGVDNVRYTTNWDEAYVGRVVIPVSA